MAATPPLLAPMSEVSGRMAIQAGACHLKKSKGGAGILLGGVHYCVANMPGAVARTSTFALANKGWRQALRDDPHLKNGLNVCEGQATHAAVANDPGYAWVPADTLLA